MDQAKASTATLGIGMMATPPPPMMEYALIKDADVPAASQRASTITVALSDNTMLTINRTSVDIRADMCVWRGMVEGTGEPATLMWWPGGKTAGMVQHKGSSIRSATWAARCMPWWRWPRRRCRGACADASAPAQQRSLAARRSARQPGRCQRPAARDGGIASDPRRRASSSKPRKKQAAVTSSST